MPHLDILPPEYLIPALRQPGNGAQSPRSKKFLYNSGNGIISLPRLNG
ncbi:hypothetical protein D082_04360 [Synechocystis sp. PCC 6714]|nr:hypothetical protein D082_04360 [Synechocystis sp. PCC 6714]